jgi:LPS O-antigen subunit length determinant protein (WzzB/FepE family)
MQNQINLNSQGAYTGADISFTDLIVPLWRSRWLILVVSLSVAACGVAGALYFAKYNSEGFFQFGGAIPAYERDKDKEPSPGISLADYKRYTASYATSERFADFVQEKQLGSTVGIESLYKTFTSRDGITKLIEPIYPFTKLDAKELMDQPKDGSNNVIGLRINYASSSPENAQQMVKLLGNYVMDSIIYQIYSDKLRFKRSEIVTDMTRLNNVIITNNELLEKYHRKGVDLKKIVSRYPESSRQASRQVISVTEDSARYLSPITLLATTEVQESEANEAIRKAKRELRQSALRLEYYDRAKALLDGTKSGENLLRGLESAKDSVFKGKNMEDDVIKEVYNKITIDNQTAINLYLERSRFIAGPTLPVRSSARPLFTLAVSLLLGLSLSVLLVFARKWWRDNMRELTGLAIERRKLNQLA